jgi:hypothetical protein
MEETMRSIAVNTDSPMKKSVSYTLLVRGHKKLSIENIAITLRQLDQKDAINPELCKMKKVAWLFQSNSLNGIVF